MGFLLGIDLKCTTTSPFRYTLLGETTDENMKNPRETVFSSSLDLFDDVVALPFTLTCVQAYERARLSHNPQTRSLFFATTLRELDAKASSTEYTVATPNLPRNPLADWGSQRH